MSDTASQHIGHIDTLNLTVSLCLCYTLCIALVRVWIRRGAFGADDLVVFFATLVTLGHTGTSYAAMAYRLGKPLAIIRRDESIAELNAAAIGGIVTFIIALYISKLGVLAFLCRITKNRTQVLGYYACCGLVAVFGLMSILIVLVACPSETGYYWAFFANRAECPSQSVRWQVVTALDIITELGLMVLPIQLVWALQMPWTKKSILIVAFYLRLPVIGLSLGRNAYTLRLRHPDSDPGLDSALVTIWLEVQLAYALASSTLSALKAFTESFNSGFGLGFTRGKSESGSYALSGLSSSGARTTASNGASGSRNSQSHSSNRPDQQQQQQQQQHKPSLTTTTANNDATTSSFLKTIKYEDTLSTPTQTLTQTQRQPLRLRPDLTSHSSTTTATASASDAAAGTPWHLSCGGGGSATSSEVESEDEEVPHRGAGAGGGEAREGLVIMRETGIEVRRERVVG